MTIAPPRHPNEPERRTAPGTTAGVFDTIADGMTLVLRRPWLMLVPLAIDLVVWLLFKVHIAPITENAARFIETSNVADADLAAESLREIGTMVYVSDFFGAFLPSLFTGLPLDTLMNQLMSLISPASGAGVDRDAIFAPWRDGLIGPLTPESEHTVAIAGLLSLLGSTLAFVLYRVPIARAIRGDSTSSVVRELWGSWLRFLAYIGLVIIVAAASIVPLAILGVVFTILGLNLTFVFAMALLIFGSMIGVYTYFVVDAILLHRFGPVRAFRLSYDVGRAYFGQTVRFALTSLFLMLGSMALWNETVGTVPGLVLALVGNAFLGTTLAASSMLFYTDRFRVIRVRRNRPA